MQHNTRQDTLILSLIRPRVWAVSLHNYLIMKRIIYVILGNSSAFFIINFVGRQGEKSNFTGYNKDSKKLQ